MDNVARLELRETAKSDRDRTELMATLLRNAAGGPVVDRMLDELGEALAEIDAAWRARDVHRIVACAATLVGMGEGAGMGDLARIARDVVKTGRCGDASAFAATVFRLTRVVEASLRAACGPCDLIG